MVMGLNEAVARLKWTESLNNTESSAGLCYCVELETPSRRCWCRLQACMFLELPICTSGRAYFLHQYHIFIFPTYLFLLSSPQLPRNNISIHVFCTYINSKSGSLRFCYLHKGVVSIAVSTSVSSYHTPWPGKCTTLCGGATKAVICW